MWSGCVGVSAPAHPLLSGYFGFWFSPSSFAIELLFEFPNPFDISWRPVAESSPTDLKRLRWMKSSRGEPALDRGWVNPDKLTNLFGRKRHIRESRLSYLLFLVKRNMRVTVGTFVTQLAETWWISFVSDQIPISAGRTNTLILNGLPSNAFQCHPTPSNFLGSHNP